MFTSLSVQVSVRLHSAAYLVKALSRFLKPGYDVHILKTARVASKNPIITKEPKKEGRVIMLLNLALGPDCVYSCVEVNGKCMEEHTITLRKMKEHTSQSG